MTSVTPAPRSREALACPRDAHPPEQRLADPGFTGKNECRRTLRDLIEEGSDRGKLVLAIYHGGLGHRSVEIVTLK